MHAKFKPRNRDRNAPLSFAAYKYFMKCLYIKCFVVFVTYNVALSFQIMTGVNFSLQYLRARMFNILCNSTTLAKSSLAGIPNSFQVNSCSLFCCRIVLYHPDYTGIFVCLGIPKLTLRRNFHEYRIFHHK